MKLSELIGKQVFVIYNSNFVGTVHDVAFDDKFTKILGIYFFDQEENEYFLKKQNIFAINDYVVIKNDSMISNDFLLDKPLSPLGKNVVSVEGLNLGSLCDMEFDEKYNIVNFVTNTNSINPKQIVNISTCILTGDVKLKNFKPRKTNQVETLKNLSVSIMRINEPEKVLMPTKITVNSDILIGKKLSKDIIGKNNELILKQNQTITSKQIMIAKQHDKLNELYYSVY